jgi:hypothetical protein
MWKELEVALFIAKTGEEIRVKRKHPVSIALSNRVL